MKKTTFCPGCGHAHISKIVEKVLQKKDGILVGSVGCSVSLPTSIEDVDAISAAHGRALAVATGIRRVLGSEKVIVTYQGDGDLANIGVGELVHTCLRNEKLVCVFINNSIFGMTGFQMAATTPLSLKTKTCPQGREEAIHGLPINVRRLVKALNPRIHYWLCDSASKEGIEKFEKIMETAVESDGFSLIEVISPCPTFFENAKKAYDHARRMVEGLEVYACRYHMEA